MRFATFVFLTVFLFQVSTAYAVLPVAGVVAGSLRAGGSLIVKGGTKTVLTTGAGVVGGIVGDRLQKWCKSNRKKCIDLGGDVVEAVLSDDDDDDCFLVKYDNRIFTGSPKKVCDSLRLYHQSKNDALNRTSKVISRYDLHECYIDNRYNTPYLYKYQQCSRYDKDELKDYLVDALKDKLSDDEFTQIINNYGDKNDFDIIVNNCTGDNSCIEIDKDFADKVNNKDYDSDKMSKDNCEVKNNKIVSCDNAKRTKDKDDDDKDDKDKKDKDDDDDDKILKCDSSEFHKKVCDWIDWTQDKEEFKDDSEVDVEDFSKKLKLDDDKIKFNRACPSGQTVNISFGGITISHQISYDGLCQAFTKMRPFVVGIGFVVGVMIIGGRRV